MHANQSDAVSCHLCPLTASINPSSLQPEHTHTHPQEMVWSLQPSLVSTHEDFPFELQKKGSQVRLKTNIVSLLEEISDSDLKAKHDGMTESESLCRKALAA